MNKHSIIKFANSASQETGSAACNWRNAWGGLSPAEMRSSE